MCEHTLRCVHGLTPRRCCCCTHRDAPNEWFYDPDAGELYWFYNATGAPPADLEVAATQLEQLITV